MESSQKLDEMITMREMINLRKLLNDFRSNSKKSSKDMKIIGCNSSSSLDSGADSVETESIDEGQYEVATVDKQKDPIEVEEQYCQHYQEDYIWHQNAKGLL